MLKFPNAPRTVTRLGGALALGLAAACAAPALAQPVAGEVVVMGRYHVGDDVRSLSAPVSYADLDLTTQAGRDILRDRVRATAHDLCSRLNESNLGGTSAAPSCEQDAVDRAQPGMRTAIAMARPPVYAVVVPPPPPADMPYVAPAGANAADSPPPAAASYGQAASATVTTQTVTNGAVPDTPENRARLGGPMSNGGRATTPAGN